MDWLITQIEEATGVAPFLARVLLIGALIVIAVIAARVLRWMFVRIYWNRAARRSRGGSRQRQVDRAKREATIVKVIESLVRYGIFGLLVVGIVLVISPGSAGAIVGASALVVILGFGFQQLMADVVAGAFMLFEDRIAVGDVIRVASQDVEGVVVEVGLRATTVRSFNGDVQTIVNGRMWAFSRVAGGTRPLILECRVDSATRAERAAARLLEDLPGPASAWLVKPVVGIDERGEAGHVRLRLHMTVAPTREWVATEAVPELLTSLLDDHLLGSVHTWSHDETAARQYDSATVVADA